MYGNLFMKRAIKEIIEFNKEIDWDQFHSPENLAKSIAIEAGELLECFQWDNNYNKEAVCEESADVVNYCIVMADKLNVDLEEIVLNKLEKIVKSIQLKNLKGVLKNITSFDCISKNNLYGVKLDLIEDKLKQENST